MSNSTTVLISDPALPCDTVLSTDPRNWPHRRHVTVYPYLSLWCALQRPRGVFDQPCSDPMDYLRWHFSHGVSQLFTYDTDRTDLRAYSWHCQTLERVTGSTPFSPCGWE